MPKKEQYSRVVIAADVVGITFFIVTNVLMLLGAFTSVFGAQMEGNTAIDFIYTYLAFPVYYLVSGVIEKAIFDPVGMYLSAELIIVVCSVLYALSVYLILRLLQALMV